MSAWGLRLASAGLCLLLLLLVLDLLYIGVLAGPLVFALLDIWSFLVLLGVLIVGQGLIGRTAAGGYHCGRGVTYYCSRGFPLFHVPDVAVGPVRGALASLRRRVARLSGWGFWLALAGVWLLILLDAMIFGVVVGSLVFALGLVLLPLLVHLLGALIIRGDPFERTWRPPAARRWAPVPAADTGWPPPFAEERAQALLREQLAEAEYEQLARHGYLEVPSPGTAGRVYRIPATGGRVGLYDGGRLVARLCLQPVEPLPTSDVILLHKLLIEADEPRYLATANHFSVEGVRAEMPA